jgi:hypothetical protein
MYVHNGSWPFKCDICSRGFSKQTNLKNHLLLHTGTSISLSKMDSPTNGTSHLKLRQKTTNMRKPLSDFSISKLTDSENKLNTSTSSTYESDKVTQMSPYGHLTTSPFDSVYSPTSGISPEAYINIAKRQSFTSSPIPENSQSIPENSQYMLYHYGRMFPDCRLLPTTDALGSSPVSTLYPQPSWSARF